MEGLPSGQRESKKLPSHFGILLTCLELVHEDFSESNATQQNIRRANRRYLTNLLSSAQQLANLEALPSNLDQRLLPSILSCTFGLLSDALGEVPGAFGLPMISEEAGL